MSERQSFSEREQEFIRKARAQTPPLSYGQIARELGRQFPQDNGGCRSRNSVYGFATADPDRNILLQVSIPKPLVEQAKTAGLDLSDALADTLKRRLRLSKDLTA